MVLSESFFVRVNDDWKPLGFPFHVAARSTTLFHGIVNAFVASATECGENILRRFLSTELAVIIFEIHTHEYRSSD